MILYFSGTGNSRALAEQLASHTGDAVFRLEDEAAAIPACSERVIWVFPIYSWGLPEPIVRAIRNIAISDADIVPHYMAATCGDDAGYADRQWRRLVSGRGWTAAAAFTVLMPNTYTMMKGFDVDAPDVARRKLSAFPGRAARIAGSILGGATESDVTRGRFAWIKSRIIYPWFMRYAVSTRPFHATAACIGCGRCARECPQGVIKMDGDRPHWNSRRCALCERCYHQCPVRAIAYGKATEGKGQYTYKDFR